MYIVQATSFYLSKMVSGISKEERQVKGNEVSQMKKTMNEKLHEKRELKMKAIPNNYKCKLIPPELVPELICKCQTKCSLNIGVEIEKRN